MKEIKKDEINQSNVAQTMVKHNSFSHNFTDLINCHSGIFVRKYPESYEN